MLHCFDAVGTWPPRSIDRIGRPNDGYTSRKVLHACAEPVSKPPVLEGGKVKVPGNPRGVWLFWSAQKPGGRNPDRQWDEVIEMLPNNRFCLNPDLFSSGFIQRQFLPPTNNLQAHRDRVRPTTWVKGLSRKRQIQVALVFGVNAILLLPTILKKDNHLTNLHFGFA